VSFNCNSRSFGVVQEKGSCFFKNNMELKRELKRHLMLNLAVRVLTTYHINIPLEKVDGIKKKEY
jgi:hypothetical protein